jgi:putative DNA primase/helicase
MRAAARFNIPETEPWPAPIDAAEVLNEVSETFSRYIILPPGGADALALWAAFTHALDAFEFSPRLTITSPQKRCAKSRLLFLLSYLANKRLVASGISAAAMFRVIQQASPTMFIDEADTFMSGNEDMRGVINSGHAREGAKFVRCDGDDNDPREYSTWAAVAIAMIGKPADTIVDRSIVIEMRRKLKSEKIEKLPRRNKAAFFEPLRRKLRRLANDHADFLSNYDPDMPDALNDRAQDNWSVLFAIAEAAGGDWPQRARDACAKITGKLVEDEDTIGVRLLSDIREAYGARTSIPSADLCAALAEDETSHWAAWGRQEKPITQKALANLLEPFGIVASRDRFNGKQRRSYARDDFEDAFNRYLTEKGGDTPLSNRHSGTSPLKSTKITEPKASQQDERVTFRNGEKHRNNNESDGVTDENLLSPDAWEAEWDRDA